MTREPPPGAESASGADAEHSPMLRTLAVSLEGIDGEWDIDERLAALWRAARLGPTVERLRRHILQEGPVTIESGQFRALDAVAAHGPCAVRELAVVMGLEPSTVTRAVGRLENNGLVEKRRSERDQREVLVALTELGLQLHQGFVERAFEVYQEIFAVFSEQERIQLADLLERMLKSTDAALASATDVPRSEESGLADNETY